jgi:hypothetical protein
VRREVMEGSGRSSTKTKSYIKKRDNGSQRAGTEWRKVWSCPGREQQEGRLDRQTPRDKEE